MSARIFCLVSDHDDVSLLPALADAGVDGFQVRAKGLATRALVDLTRVVAGAVRPYGAVVVVNDRLDVALAARADGVHLGAEDLTVADARRIAPGMVIGATCRSVADVKSAERAGASYVGLGPVFATTSKVGLPAPLGTEAVAAAHGLLPIIAIGGVDATNARSVIAAGAHGVAVIGAIWRHPDPVSSAKELVAAIGG